MPASPTMNVLSLAGVTITPSLFGQLDVVTTDRDVDLHARVNRGRRVDTAHAIGTHRATNTLVHVEIKYRGEHTEHPRTVSYERVLALPLVMLGRFVLDAP